uniref:Uncharacterized protein P0446G09.138 n=2 Tax=Oryza sativa subsp. japonica TaxID=39947 RepID=Q7EYT4_ORYSJ|nr:hypothetical protein [Oryza sativa Japonica Group]BAD31745.1 hypothetical protein [Oryza sativa Japonica Group]
MDGFAEMLSLQKIDRIDPNQCHRQIESALTEEEPRSGGDTRCASASAPAPAPAPAPATPPPAPPLPSPLSQRCPALPTRRRTALARRAAVLRPPAVQYREVGRKE